ncbi:hypothetical protein [Pleomorphochaeta sp. DL1XJH-081]|uniref:hypothetical protein n=1 Tax=Pleomorphochaeta sp. DL1XJH-081 TaxID=3409690 RepID=UPI003BB59C51
MLKINPEKALVITQERIRAWREEEFKKNDINLQNALVDGTDTTQFVERRNWLRDLPQMCEGKTVEELKAFILELGVVGG